MEREREREERRGEFLDSLAHNVTAAWRISRAIHLFIDI
jgi:hypothetical protein